MANSPYNYGSYAAQGSAYQRNRNRKVPTNPLAGATKPVVTTQSGSWTVPQYTASGTPWYYSHENNPYGWEPKGGAANTLKMNLDERRAATQEWYNQLGVGNQPPAMPGLPGSGGGRGGGGGGGGAGAGGLDQATLDWLMNALGRGRPQGLQQTMLDLPDPSQYLGAFNTQPYDVAAQGVTSGIEAMRQRAGTAYDQALGGLNTYQNPYRAGLQNVNPDLNNRLAAMAQANNAQGTLDEVNQYGVQADNAMGNTLALLAANDQARQAANLRALQGDRTTTEQNLGLEGNMLNLGVNMAKAKGSSAWDQMVRQAQLEAAQTEAAQNWQRGNAVADTNVNTQNQWMQSVLQNLLSLVPNKAAGATLPDLAAYFQGMGIT